MTRVVERSVEYAIRTMRVEGVDIAISAGASLDIEAMAEDEQRWLQDVFNQKVLLVTDTGERITLSDALRSGRHMPGGGSFRRSFQ